MTMHLKYFFMNAFFFVIAEAHRRGTIMLPGSTRPPDFPKCSNVDRVVGGCRDKMASYFHRHRRGISVDNPEEFENCLLHRQELTLREYAAWCEHRSSVARKMAVCFRHIIDKQMRSLSQSVLSKGIQRFQDCILGKHESTASSPVVIEETENQSHEEEDSVERYRPNVVVIGEDENDYDNRDRESESEEHEPLLVAEEPHRRDTKRRRKKVKQPDETRNRGTWSYPIHDQSYYYPRREKGLGNETSPSLNATVEIPPTPIEMAKPMTKPPPATTQK
nr:uncharacterized protein LOC119162420 [Rhipicephalus microplus]